MRVLHVLDHSVPVMSGYSVRSRSIVTFQKRLGLEPVVVTSDRQGPTRTTMELHDGIRYYRMPLRPPGRMAQVPLLREMLTMRRLAARVAEVARRERVDVLHAHSSILNGLPALLVGRRLGLPVVYEARAFWEDAAVDHGTCQPQSARYVATRAAETFLFKRVNAGIVICQAMRDELIRRGVAPGKVHVVPNGVDADWFQPRPRATAPAERWGLNGGPVFGFIGSFLRYEGLEGLLRATPQIVRHLPQAKILLVGGGPQEAELQALAKSIGDSVIMPGRLPHDQVRDVYSTIDVFVCPRIRSRQTELVTPLKPLEAMAMARPVLASNVGGLKELIEPDVTGLLFEADDPEALVTQAVRIGRDESLRRRLGETARVRVADERSWASIVARYPAIYGAPRP